jgi:hypothetical protein
MGPRAIPNSGPVREEIMRFLFSGDVTKRPAQVLPEVQKGRRVSDVERKA